MFQSALLRSLAVIGILSLSVYPASADNEKAIEELSIDEILNLPISVATKKTETIGEAPAIVSVITREDISRLGYKTLYDIIQTVPGVTVTESFFGQTDVAFRGILENHYNNRTLFMVNGAPLRDVGTGTYWLETVPINMIERIEIIRGPGSVMYGNGAFAGTINVITRKAENSVDVNALARSRKSLEGDLSVARVAGKFGMIAGGSRKLDDGYFYETKDVMGFKGNMGGTASDNNGYRDNYNNFFGTLNYGSLSVDLMHIDLYKDKYGLLPLHMTAGEQNYKNAGATAHYQKNLGGVDINAQARYYQVDFVGFVQRYPVTNSSLEINSFGKEMGGELDGSKRLNDQFSLLGGLSFDRQEADPLAWHDLRTGQDSESASCYLRAYDTQDVSAYTQVEYVPIKLLKMVGGVRYNNNKDYGSTAVPRFSSVFTLSDHLHLKALYGAAYRNPTFYEKYINSKNLVYGDPDLKPERIDTTELGLDWVFEKRAVRFSVFDIQTDNMIDRSRIYYPGDRPSIMAYEPDRNTAPTNPLGTPGYGNMEGQRIQGTELEVRGEVWKRTLSYSANVSYKDGKNKDGNTAIQYLDKFVANAVFTLMTAGLRNNLAIHYVGERTGNISSASGYAAGGGRATSGFTRGQEVQVPGYTLVNWKTSYNIYSNISVGVTILNLFEQKVLYPEYILRDVDTVPGDSGRVVFGEVGYHF